VDGRASIACYRLLTLAWLATACAGHVEPFPERAESRVELISVPFFAQRTHQCGPAALATVLVHAGVDADPDALIADVYLPGREGSLQLEMVAAVRRRERVPFVLEGGIDALVAELEAGRPVLVLQNLGVALIPFWHYAVVIGFDRERDVFVLRSGTTERRVEGRRIFLRTWTRSGQWGFVVLMPGEIAASAEPGSFFAALAAVEAVGARNVAQAGYRAFTERWPQRVEGHFGIGNLHLARGEWRAAEAAYRRALTVAPGDVATRNNLAMALLGRGCGDAAVVTAREAQAALGNDDPRRGAVADTLEQAIERAREPDAENCPLVETGQDSAHE
jgi:hypothetical protein